MRQCALDVLMDTSRYENIDSMHVAFVHFTDSIIQTATEMRMEVPYERWQELWEPFQKSRFFYDGLDVTQPETEGVSHSPST